LVDYLGLDGPILWTELAHCETPSERETRHVTDRNYERAFAKKLRTSRVGAATLPKEGRRVVGWMLRSPGRFRDLPVRQPMKSEIVNEFKAARALGLTITQSLLLRAEEVFP
jgi:hypothetical protein